MKDRPFDAGRETHQRKISGTGPQRREGSRSGSDRKIHTKEVIPESPFPHVESLPDAGVSKFREGAQWLGSLDLDTETPFLSELPTVLGAVSPEEWDFLNSAHFENEKSRGTRVLFDFTSQEFPFSDDVALLRSRMPNVLRMIEADLQKFSPEARVTLAKLDRVYTEAGDAPRETTHWHSDTNVDIAAFGADAVLPRYVISGDTFTTECYAGDARIGGNGSRRDIAVDEDTPSISAPPRTVLRMGPNNLHRTPVFTEAAERTFITFLANG